MKRKVYATSRERKLDQLIGFAAFPILNLILWAVLGALGFIVQPAYGPLPGNDLVSITILALPWIMNGMVLALAFAFRPQIGIRYLAFIVIGTGASIALSFLLVAACFTSLIVAIPFMGFRNDAASVVLLVVFFGLSLAGLIFLGWLAVGWIRNWWAGGVPGGAGGETLPPPN